MKKVFAAAVFTLALTGTARADFPSGTWQGIQYPVANTCGVETLADFNDVYRVTGKLLNRPGLPKFTRVGKGTFRRFISTDDFIDIHFDRTANQRQALVSYTITYGIGTFDDVKANCQEVWQGVFTR